MFINIQEDEYNISVYFPKASAIRGMSRSNKHFPYITRLYRSKNRKNIQ